MTGSVVLPIKALLINALTAAAATGLLVFVFQDGRLQGPLGYTSQDGIEQTDFLVLAALVFALSTDYGVLLLTRIKEAHDRGLPDREAIAGGLERTGRLVTASAVLLAVALGAFATSQVVFLKEIGIGAVVAVLIDAFLVRALARAVADGAARALELVVAGAAAPAPRPVLRPRGCRAPTPAGAGPRPAAAVAPAR